MRDDVLEVFKDCAKLQFHLCVGLHSTLLFPNTTKYENNYLCSFIDMSNYDLLFNKSSKHDLENFIRRVETRSNKNNKKSLTD
jgi:hypothetical protein